MIQPLSRLAVADNSGAKVVSMIQITSQGKNKAAKIGDIITVTIKEALSAGTVKRKEKTKAVIVRTKNALRRIDGSVVRFDDNACVLINPDLSLRGTRIFGPVPRELKEKGWLKIISLAKEVV